MLQFTLMPKNAVDNGTDEISTGSVDTTNNLNADARPVLREAPTWVIRVLLKGSLRVFKRV